MSKLLSALITAAFAATLSFNAVAAKHMAAETKEAPKAEAKKEEPKKEEGKKEEKAAPAK